MSARAKLSALRKAAKRQQEQTKAVHVEVTEKRAKKKAKPLELKPTTPKVKPVNSTQVEQWFTEELRELYGSDYIISRWTIPQKTLAKRLLDTYGPDLVRQAVSYLAKHWKLMVKRSKGSLSGVPTVNLLWGMRERVFAEVQGVDNTPAMEDRPENSDEWRPGEDRGDSKIGW